MTIRQLHVEGYRSIRRIFLDLKQINVIVGPNGSGKSNLYRSLYLIAAAANNQFARELANEGGMPSVLWAGDRRKNEKTRMYLQVKLEELEYKLVCGRVPCAEIQGGLLDFLNDPDIKEEEVSISYMGRSNVIVRRAGRLVSAKNMDGRKVEYPLAVTQRESILSGLRDPHKFPELASLREEFLNWRFYHQFRTDLESPLRLPQIGVLTPVMAHDGSDVAVALASIKAMEGPDAIDKLVDEAFPGAQVNVDVKDNMFSLCMRMPGINRAFEAFELSDGTLQYICLLAALMSPRPPSLMVFNEPETSIHPELLEPLAKLIVRSSKKSQIILTTHSRDLAGYIRKLSKIDSMELEKVDGETRLIGATLPDIEDEGGDEEQGSEDD